LPSLARFKVTSMFIRAIPVIILIILKIKLVLKSDRRMLLLPNIKMKSFMGIESNKFLKNIIKSLCKWQSLLKNQNKIQYNKELPTVLFV
jgi:hypothetical protein